MATKYSSSAALGQMPVFLATAAALAFAAAMIAIGFHP
jgi:hypothetical protein